MHFTLKAEYFTFPISSGRNVGQELFQAQFLGGWFQWNLKRSNEAAARKAHRDSRGKAPKAPAVDDLNMINQCKKLADKVNLSTPIQFNKKILDYEKGPSE